nr:hypothetical protein [Streptomyces sp. TRM49041]
MSSDQQYPYDPYAEPDVAQRWEGQTWDTHYQPAVQPQAHPHTQAQAHPHDQAQAQAQARQPGHEGPADATMYLPPQQAPGAYPLPPEAPAQQQAPGYDAPTSYLPPVTDQRQSPSYGQAPAPSYAYDAPRHARPQPEGSAPAAAAPADTAEYSVPTTMGNARITDAQRARAEGRSPIIDPGIQPAGLTALLAVLLAVGAAVGPYGLLVPLVLLQAVTAAGWFRLNGMWPARQGIALAFLGGVVADAALLAAGREHAPAAILGTLGVWVLLVLVLQLRSHAAPEERMYGLMATVASSALAVVAAGFLAADPDAVVVGALAVAAATVARALPLPGVASLVVALSAGAGAGAAAGAATGFGAQGAVLGFAAGVCAAIGLRVAAYDYPSRFVHMTAGVALPLAVAAPAVYLLGRTLV